MTVEANRKVVRVTTGLDTQNYLDTSMVRLMSVPESYTELGKRMHPSGLCCPCGSGSSDAYGHGRNANGYPVFRCRECGKTYSILTGTLFSGCTLGARELLLMLRMIGEQQTAAEIGPMVGLTRKAVAQMMVKIKIYASRVVN